MPARAPSNRYYIGSKISERAFNALLLWFLAGESPSEVARKVKIAYPDEREITQKSIRHLFGLLRRSLFNDPAVLDLFAWSFSVSLVPDLRALAKVILPSFKKLEDGERAEFAQSCHTCLFQCSFGPRVNELLQDYGDILTSYNLRIKEGEAFEYYKRVKIFDARVRNRIHCDECSVRWLKLGPPNLWESMAVYMKSYRALQGDQLREVLYSSLLFHFIKSNARQNENERRIQERRNQGDKSSLVANSPKRSEMSEEEWEDYVNALHVPLHELHSICLDYLIANPLRNR